MNELHLKHIAEELNLSLDQVLATAKLFEEGATVPFIARYRKEVTKGLDEVAITAIRDRCAELKALDERRTSIIKSLTERKLLTDELSAQIEEATSLSRLEDIYQPYRPKRRTRAMMAIEKGLEGLADYILENQDAAIEDEAKKFIVEDEDKDKAVPNIDEALKGARDIIAERISDDTSVRTEIRKLFNDTGVLKSSVAFGKEKEGEKYSDYFEFREDIKKIPSHRLLAIRRGSNEGFLYYSIKVEEAEAHQIIKKHFLNGNGKCAKQMVLAIEDGYKRLLSPSIETDIRIECKRRAEEDAIKVFSDNLKELLLAAPLGQKRVLAIDPGFRTGCKVVCLDPQGTLLHDDVIYPTTGGRQVEEATHTILRLCHEFKIEAIAIGNGTASRETEAFVKKLGLPKSITIVMVNESGASIYSASEVARDEFPDKDVTVRGSVSIGRRLMDPLAELVKIDPKSIGVGQYQHDIDEYSLKRGLDDTVVNCVNSVGVEVNSASKQLLQYVAGLNSRIADNIIKHRSENGKFKSRKELLDVSGMGKKTYEQCAGFLRIRNGEHPLDASAVHPERYSLVEQMANDASCSIDDLLTSEKYRQKIDLKKYETEEVGLPTLKDIQSELSKPGRDPREQFEAFSFSDGVNEIEDLKEGMRLPGIITNVAAFGAFVDIGVHQDGLVHVSELSDEFVKNPADVVKVAQRVQVVVTEVDVERKRIGLSMKTRRDDNKPIQNRHKGGTQKNSQNRKPNKHGGQKPKRQKAQSFGNTLGEFFN